MSFAIYYELQSIRLVFSFEIDYKTCGLCSSVLILAHHYMTASCILLLKGIILPFYWLCAFLLWQSPWWTKICFPNQRSASNEKRKKPHELCFPFSLAEIASLSQEPRHWRRNKVSHSRKPRLLEWLQRPFQTSSTVHLMTCKPTDWQISEPTWN